MSDGSNRLLLSGPARRDLAAIDRYTVRTFGEAAADRYSMLLRQALRDLREDPDRPGVRTSPDALGSGICLYHLLFSRARVAGQPVKEPRHFIAFRRRGQVVEILRILHDSRDLPRHLPTEPVG